MDLTCREFWESIPHGKGLRERSSSRRGKGEETVPKTFLPCILYGTKALTYAGQQTLLSIECCWKSVAAEGRDQKKINLYLRGKGSNGHGALNYIWGRVWSTQKGHRPCLKLRFNQNNNAFLQPSTKCQVTSNNGILAEELQDRGDHHGLGGKSKAGVTLKAISLANQHPTSIQGVARGIWRLWYIEGTLKQ